MVIFSDSSAALAAVARDPTQTLVSFNEVTWWLILRLFTLPKIIFHLLLRYF